MTIIIFFCDDVFFEVFLCDDGVLVAVDVYTKKNSSETHTTLFETIGDSQFNTQHITI